MIIYDYDNQKTKSYKFGRLLWKPNHPLISEYYLLNPTRKYKRVIGKFYWGPL